MQFKHCALAAVAAIGWGAAAHAADPASVQAPIHPQGVEEKGRSGPDGWSWAPQTRNEQPAAAPGTGGQSSSLNSQPGPNTAKNLPAGQDPGTPMAPTAATPGSVAAKASN